MTSRTKLLAAVAICSLIPVYWISFHAPAVGLFHDDGIYMVTAKALAEGKGYRIISLPDELPQTHYPILFPALLAVLWKLFPRFPENVFLLRALPLLCALIWLGLVYRFVGEETGDDDVAICIALFTAASPWVVFLSTSVLSETLFACLYMAALPRLCRIEVDGSVAERTSIVISATLTAAAFLTRTAALPLFFAGSLTLLLKNRYAVALKFAMICAVLVVPWLWWQAMHSAGDEALKVIYSGAGYKALNILTNYTWQQKALVFSQNISILVLTPGILLGVKAGVIAVAFGLAFFFLVLCGFVEDLGRGFSSLHLFLFLYIGMLLAWAWPPPRFVVPVLPLLLLFGYKGLRRVCRDFFRDRRALPLANQIVALVLVVALAHGLVMTARKTISYGSLTPFDLGHTSWWSLSSLMDWVRGRTLPDAVLLNFYDPTFYLYTGRKGVSGFILDPVQLYYAREVAWSSAQISSFTRIVVEQKVGYIVRTPAFAAQVPFLDDWIRALERESPAPVRLLMTSSDPNYRIYEVDRAKLLDTLNKKLPGIPAESLPDR